MPFLCRWWKHKLVTLEKFPRMYDHVRCKRCGMEFGNMWGLLKPWREVEAQSRWSATPEGIEFFRPKTVQFGFREYEDGTREPFAEVK